MVGGATISQKQARSAADRVAARLSDDPRVRLVYLFGSSLDQSRPVVRDIDIAVLFEVAPDLDELLRLRADLVALAGAPIDLVALNEAGVVLTHEVAATGLCLFAADDDVRVEFLTRANARYWDFKPVLAEQWRLLGERWATRRHGAAT